MAAFAQLASVRHQQCRMYEFLMGAVLGAELGLRFTMWALLLPVLGLLVFSLQERAAI